MKNQALDRQIAQRRKICGIRPETQEVELHAAEGEKSVEGSSASLAACRATGKIPRTTAKEVDVFQQHALQR